MNAKLLRRLVERHAPDSVKETLQTLDSLDHEKRALRARVREAEHLLEFGPRTGEVQKCHCCGVENPLNPHHSRHSRNGHVLALADAR
jgi:hypothetical protein